MSEQVERRRRGSRWRVMGWGIAAGLLLTPLVAMQFTREVNWTASDFVFAAVLIGGTGLLFELVVRTTRNSAYRGGVAAALAVSFLTIWANGAVGMIGDEGNAYNLVFLGVIALALLGAIVASFRAEGMSIAMALAALAQFAASVVGMSADLRGGIFSAMFAGIWLLSAALFAKAARDRKAAAAASNG